MQAMGETARIRVPPHDLRPLLPGTDERLARRAALGDSRAFEAIFARYHQRLYRYCHAIVGNREDAQDALQSTMASALRSLPGEAREIALRPWLFRVAHNHAVSIVRARRSTADTEALLEVADRRQEEKVESRARLRQLLADLDALSENQRGALTMRELSGLSFAEIGAALGISKQAARQTLYEARLCLDDLERGRAMGCERICELLSAGDRRVVRSRRVRAHLRACADCRRFRDAIATRRGDLAALAPPLPPLAAAALLPGGLGATGTGAGASLAGSSIGVAKGLGASAAVKSVASVVAAGAIGVGAAGYTALIDGPGNGPDRDPSTAAMPVDPAAPAPGVAATAPESADGPAGPAPASDASAGDGGAGSPASPPEHSSAGDNGGGPPAHANAGGVGPPAHANAGGSPATPPVQSNAGGNGGGPPDHSNAGGNGAPPAHSNAGAGGPPAHSNAGGVHGQPTQSADHMVGAAGDEKPPKPEQPSKPDAPAK
jgi:RNA polymerase sigma factor (sigma-70 family)